MNSSEDTVHFDGLWLDALRPVERWNGICAPPEWFLFLDRAYRHTSPHCGDGPPQFPPFSDAVRPLCAEAKKLLFHNSADLGKEIESAVDLPALVDDLEIQLRNRLASAGAKCFVTTMGALSDAGMLPGRSAEDRYQVFVDSLRDPSFTWEILERFPVLARRLSVMAMNWHDALLEFIGRFMADRKPLTASGLLDQHSGRLVSADAVGDPHRGGRQGYILSFEAGGKLVYKPRSVEPEARFQALLDWIGARDPLLELLSCTVLSCEGYGWAEFIHHRPCATLEEVEQFFYRQGANLALLHALRGTDMHHENLIACGSYPILVDLETLFHPVYEHRTKQSASEDVRERLASSVRRTHMLPIVMGEQNRQSGRLDIGGLGFSDDENSRVEIFKWASKGSDEMRMERGVVTLEAAKNLPTLNGNRVDVRVHCERVVDGFETMDRFISDNAYQLLSAGGPIDKFKSALHRVIPRATELYSELLFDSFDPDLSAKAEYIDNYLKARLIDDAQRYSKLNDIISHELDDLWQGDIPYFWKPVGDVSVRGSDGTDLSNLGLSNAWTDCVNRFRDPDADRSLQVQLIRWSLYDLREQFYDVPTSDTLRHVSEERADPIAIAIRLADHLAERGVWRDRRVSWLTVNDALDGRFVPRVASHSLYDGLSGIALAFLYLGYVLGENRYTRIAHAALDEALELVRNREAHCSLGAFDGLGGLIYALTHAGACSGDRKWLAEAKRIAGRALERIDEHNQLDIISGHAGFIACLVALNSVEQDEVVLRAAKTSARALTRGLGELADGGARSPLMELNFAHGRAGIGWALLRLAKACDDPALRETGEALVLLDLNNWRPECLVSNLSSSVAAEIASGADHLAWCSGPLGIVLSLICHDEEVGTIPAAQIAEALIKGLRPGRCNGRLALCHGDFGNLELILEATRRGILDTPTYLTEFRRGTLDRLVSNNCKQDLSTALDCPGLMTGHAGVIYGLVRATFPDDVPSVLMLEPPAVR